MNEQTARKILGLKPKENPRGRMEEFEKVLARKQGFVDNSPSRETKARYKKELNEYQKAYDWVEAWLATQKKGGSGGVGGWMVVLLLIAILAGGGWWKYDQQQKEMARQQVIREARLRAENLKRIESLKIEGDLAVSKRKWPEAQKAFEAVRAIDAISPVAQAGFDAIEKGKLDEKNQKIFYLLGKSQAALEAGQWDEATRLAQSVLRENPGHQEALLKLEKITAQRYAKELEMKVARVNKALELGQLSEAQKSLTALKKYAPDHAQIPELAKRLNRAMAALQARQRKAITLLDEAKKLDRGEFSAEAVKLLDEAKRLDPQNPDVVALYEKMSNYVRTLEVPAKFDTIARAILMARPKDRIRVAPGVYKESITLDKNVRLEGSADGKTILEVSAEDGPVVTILPTASGVYFSGFVLRHSGFDYDDDRSSALIIQGAKASIVSCAVQHAAGHGIAVIDGAKVIITGCEVSDSGWDGISVYGEASTADIKNTISQKNLQQGVGFWKGGSGSVRESRMLANGLCGVLAMSPGTQVNVQTCLCARNRGAGILISDQVKAEVLANRCDKNLLSGIVARGAGTTVSVRNCIATGNQEAGILIHTEVKQEFFTNNKASKNKRRQIWVGARIGK